MDTLFFVIVERGTTATILSLAQDLAIEGATVFLGHGTARSRFFATRFLPQQPKEVVLLRTDSDTASLLHTQTADALGLKKRKTGIACSIPLTSKKVEDAALLWQCIVTIVEKGKSEEVMRAARKVGAPGGTVIAGRGAGVPAHYYVDLAIEPQKELVLILAPTAAAETISAQIIADLDLERTGGGMLFSLGVSQITGLAEEEEK